MANENSDGYHGYRYLMDAKNSRQYAIHFNHGKLARSIQVFADDMRAAVLKPNETFYALDDDAAEVINTAEGMFISTIAYWFTTSGSSDGIAERTDGAQAPVMYKIILESDPKSNKAAVRYELTPESLAELRAQDFGADFPPSFREPLGSPSDIAHLGSDLLGMLPFPPHHDGKAYIARKNTGDLEAGNTLTTQPHQEDEPMSNNNDADNDGGNRPRPNPRRPANDFNLTAPAPATRVAYKVPDATIETLIKQYCIDFSARAAQGKLDPVIGRDRETDEALKIMLRRKQASLCFTGEAGVGKSAMFAAIAQRLNDDDTLPESLRGARVVELDLQAMNAGAKFRGEFEGKIKPLIDGLKEREGVLKGRKVILAIDEIHSQLTAGKAEGGSDAGNMMKGFLTANGISVLGTTTDDEYRKYIEKDPALASRFEKKRIEPPNEADTIAIIKGLWPLTKAKNRIAKDLTDEDIEYIVTQTNRHAPQEAQPRKSEKVMNTAAASAEFEGRDLISRKDIMGAVAQMANLPVSFIDKSDDEKILNLETNLPKRVLGQPGIQALIDGVIGAQSGLGHPGKPRGCFVFQGPTGTGKTEVCKALALELFGTEDNMVKIDMSQYMEKHAVAGLIGAPPGYVGFEDTEPLLTKTVSRKPNCILLLDEIEKAHPDVFNVLLPILNDGKMTDNKGKTVLFSNVIIVMTTNAGAERAMSFIKGDRGGAGFAGSKTVRTHEEKEKGLGEIYADALKAKNGGPFRPELIGRIAELGRFVTFVPLEPEVIQKLVVRGLEDINGRLNSSSGANIKGVQLEVSEEVKAQLATEGYDQEKGARDLLGVLVRRVQNPLGKWLMKNKTELLAFVAENGAAKLLVDSLDAFEPKMVKADVPEVSATNDNAAPDEAAPKREVKITIRKPRRTGPEI